VNIIYKRVQWSAEAESEHRTLEQRSAQPNKERQKWKTHLFGALPCFSGKHPRETSTIGGVPSSPVVKLQLGSWGPKYAFSISSICVHFLERKWTAIQPSRQSPRSIEITRLSVVLCQASVELLTKILLKNFHKISRKSPRLRGRNHRPGFGYGPIFLFGFLKQKQKLALRNRVTVSSISVAAGRSGDLTTNQKLN